MCIECISLALLGLDLGISGGSLLSGLLSWGESEVTSAEVEGCSLGSDWGDEVLSNEILDDCSGNGTADLELLNQDRSGDAEHLWNLLDDAFVLLLLKEHVVVKLLLNLDLGP